MKIKRRSSKKPTPGAGLSLRLGGLRAEHAGRKHPERSPRKCSNSSCKYLENALRDAHKENRVEKIRFLRKIHARIFSFVIGMLLQAKGKKRLWEILRDLNPMVLQMIGAAVPA